MLYLKVENDFFGMETIFKTDDPVLMQDRVLAARVLWPDKEVTVTA